MAPDNIDDYQASAPFEGPEKLLEIWFSPSASLVPDYTKHGTQSGLRQVHRTIWEDMLSIVKCEVLSMMEGTEFDAYLLSESSLFISPHKLILKTCGTTLNLLGLPRILDIAAQYAKMPAVYRCFYSRKSFMFPERQKGPHKDWKQEVEFLDNLFKHGAAYTIGKVNGDHWLLYMVSQSQSTTTPPPRSLPEPTHAPDYTIEILMSDLGKSARESFVFPPGQTDKSPSSLALDLSRDLGITDIFPSHLTKLDAFAFTPCGYSSNAIVKWDSYALPKSLTLHPSLNSGEGYFTIHVTPEEGWSYASFECNVPLSTATTGQDSNHKMIPDIETLVRRVVSIFQPGRLTLTLFISSRNNDDDKSGSAIEAAQKAFRSALIRNIVISESDPANGTLPGTYRRTDKINYEFGDYDLAFASFELI